MFSYIARDVAGQRVTGRLSGNSEQAVLAELHARSLAPVRVEAVREERVRLIRRHISSRTLANLYRQLSDLLRAGVPLLRALRLLSRSKSHPRLAIVMREVASDVADGERLSDSLEVRRDVFPPVQVAMVRAGEAGGFLEQVLNRLGTFLEQQADMKSRVIGNLIYPLVLLVLASAVVVGALVFFVPKFKTMFSKIDLPLPTKILLGLSDLLTTSWPLVLAGIVAVMVGLAWLWGQESVRRRVAEVQLRIPGVGPFVSTLAVARFSRILGTMLGNGIPMLTAMRISRDAAGHPVLAEAIDEAIEAVRAGESLAEPLARSGMIGDDVIEMIRVGEAANNLPEVLVTVADTIEKRIDRMLALLMRLMEPALLLFLASIVLFIFVALFLPMVRMSSAIGS